MQEIQPTPLPEAVPLTEQPFWISAGLLPAKTPRNRPYTIYFKSTDNPPSADGSGLATFRTWNITVAGAPEGLYGQVKNIGEITLNWSDYFCSAAKSIAIYRIENSFTFPQDNCQPGVPANSGFELIATVNPDDNTFLDDNNGTGSRSEYHLLLPISSCFR